MEFDKLIVAVGRSSNVDNILNDDLGVSIKNGLIEVDEYCQTSVSNIWAVGDVVRGPMLALKEAKKVLWLQKELPRNILR